MDKLETLATVVAVADCKSFAAAARAQRVSPTAVTRAIAALEATLGVQLFHRTTRSVTLTDAGAAYVERTRQVLADLQSIERSVMGRAATPRGQLFVTAPVVFGRIYVVPIVAKLIRQFPHLSVRLLLVDRVVQLAEEGIDIAVRIGELADSSLRAVSYGEVRRVLVASPSYLATHGTPQNPQELKRHTTIAFTGLTRNDEWRFGAEEKTSMHIQPRLILNSADAGIEAAKQGIGIGQFLSYQVSKELALGQLQTVLDQLAPAPLPINLVYAANRSASANVRAFIDTAREQRGAHAA